MKLHSQTFDQDNGNDAHDNARPRREGPTEQTEEGEEEAHNFEEARPESKRSYLSPPPTSPSVAMQQVNPSEKQTLRDNISEHNQLHEDTTTTLVVQNDFVMTSLDAKPDLHLANSAMTHINLDKPHHHLLMNHNHNHNQQQQQQQQQQQHHHHHHHPQHLQQQHQNQQQMSAEHNQLQQQRQHQHQHQHQLPANRPKPRGRRKKIRTEPIRPICPLCEKQFSNQSALTKHKLTHSDERRFACPQCSKAFKRHDHLTGHMQTHSNRKPFTCNIQGCDKTYCDARSLRRHKENIHHIVTPRDNNTNNTTSANPAGNHQHQHPSQNHHHHHLHHHHHHNSHIVHNHQELQHPGSIDHKSTNGILLVDNNNNINTTTNNNNNHDSSNLHSLTLMSNGTNNIKNEMNNQIDSTSPPSYQVDSTVSSSTLTTTNSNGANANTTDQNQSVQLVEGSTIYSTTQTNNNTDGNNATATTTCNLNNTATTNNSVPPPPPQQQQPQQPQQPLAPNQHQQPAQHQEPSHLLRRRIQRLHSDQSGAYSCNVDQLACFTVPPHSLGPPPPLTQPNGNSNHPHYTDQYLSSNNNNNHHPQHASFSADYASTQHFNFDFAHVNTNHHQTHHGSHHHLGHSADLTHLGTPLEHTLSTGSVPHSADSVTDSGLGLNMHYEQHTPQPLAPPRYGHQLLHPQQQQQPHHHQQAQQHHVSYSAGYATTQHFDFDINSNTTTTTATASGNGNNNASHQQQTPGSAQPVPQSASAFDFAPMGNNQHQPHHQSLDHALNTGSVPHSADSVADSGLSLNLHYEQQTPQLALGPPRYHQQHQVSYSAGYATTQHFDFDFNNNTLQARGIES